ncbi:MAG: RluA family pseudouridine synthase [Luminiphilus sp.]|nr:RluA family pseudouridine synthase [Luminiphilus sp.]
MNPPADEAPPYLVPHSQEAIRLLYRDSHLLIVDKPSLLLSVPGRHPKNYDCLLARLGRRYPGVSAVHRLDLDTSGVMIVPRRREALSHLARQFQERQVDKIYVARVAGHVSGETGEVDLPLTADWPNRPKQKVCGDFGKAALTKWRVLSRDAQSSLLELKPVTGRSHQLRIHMKEMGHPILGCDFYAPASVLSAAPRLLLHATQIRFHHPVSGHRLTARSPPPALFQCD